MSSPAAHTAVRNVAVVSSIPVGGGASAGLDSGGAAVVGSVAGDTMVDGALDEPAGGETTVLLGVSAEEPAARSTPAAELRSTPSSAQDAVPARASTAAADTPSRAVERRRRPRSGR